ncbi:MlaD family protein [Algihabitans albus]|uniref:MlaD family protein n=1 Tax=Algihabitans albus TaxID=2164067 RepID=UPI000E5C86BA|nr:MlaD family protein [Algihabitans albus]
METRANYVLVGSFVLALFLSSFAFIIWLAKFQVDTTFQRYDLLVSDSVTGLAVGSPVRYSGVRVGDVVDIQLEPDDPGTVRVMVELESDVPVKADTIASLELEGLTGGRYVLLQGGTAGTPDLRDTAEADVPTITTEASSLDQVLQGVPDAVAALQGTMGRVNLLLSDTNLQSIENTLSSVEILATTLAGRREDVARLIDDASGTLANLNEASGVAADLARDARDQFGTLTAQTNTTLVAVQRLAERLEGEVDTSADSLDQMIGELRGAARSLDAMSLEVQGLVQENREPIRDFTSTGLYELANLLTEARSLVTNLNRVSLEVQRDPARFIFGDQQEGYEAPR